MPAMPRFSGIHLAPTGASVNKLRQTTVAINKLANSGAFSSVSDIDVWPWLYLGECEGRYVSAVVWGFLCSGCHGDASALRPFQSYQASDFDTAIRVVSASRHRAARSRSAARQPGSMFRPMVRPRLIAGLFCTTRHRITSVEGS